ncbi:MAG: FG-GAP-like repeat-containing protein [Polyangiales bacterium]
MEPRSPERTPRGDTSLRRSRRPTWAILFAIAALARCTSNAGPAADVPHDDAGPRCDGAHCPAQCPADTADCDGDVSTGCETLTAFDPVNCGACGVVCRVGVPCLRGACGCRDGFSVCRSACVNLLDDALNCGACGVTCPFVDGARRCANGVCVGSCPPGRGDCDANPSNGCEVDVTASFVHCGACRVRCPIGSTCVGGVCRCGEGAVTCGRECVDTRSDARHCGACGHACVGGDCVDGRCVCPAGRVLCGTSRCVDTSSDAANCGRCDVVCAAAPRASALCRDSTCALRCDAGTGDCNGVSGDGCEIDVATDREHCGACDVRCRADQRCQGACVCPVSLLECAGACVDTLTTAAHCGACGRPCRAGWSCEHGACYPPCVAPLARCGGACAWPSDAANCGACGHACAMGERCAAGECLPVARPIAPLSTSTTLSVRPRFRWHLPPAATGARIQIFRDAACTVAVTDQVVPGDTWRPSSAMLPGTYFWRLVATRDGVASTVASPTWFFRVETRGDTRSGVGVTGSNFDVDADGFADVVVGDTDTSLGAGYTPPRFFLYRGSPTGPSPDGWRLRQGSTSDDEFGYALASAGDVNGDGHADLIVGDPLYVASRFAVYLGNDHGLPPTPQRIISTDGFVRLFGRSVDGAGDVNGDGYADVVAKRARQRSSRRQRGRNVCVPRRPRGHRGHPATRFYDRVYGSNFGSMVAGLGDERRRLLRRRGRCDLDLRSIDGFARSGLRVLRWTVGAHDGRVS